MLIWIIISIIVLAVAVSVSAFLLPKIYLKDRYVLSNSDDRGIKKVLEKNGVSMVFEPALKWRKYIRQYVLSERQGKKRLLCKIHEDIAYLSYDVALFNNRDEVFDVLTIREKIKDQGYTQTVALPDETSYVAVTVNEVDGKDFCDGIKPVRTTNRKNVRPFLFWSSVSILMETFCFKVCCANLFGGVFKEVFILNWETTLTTLVMAVVLILMHVAITRRVFRTSRKKK